MQGFIYNSIIALIYGNIITIMRRGDWMKDVTTLALDFNEIDPYIRYANLLQCEPGFSNGPREDFTDHQFLTSIRGEESLNQ